MNWNKEKDVGVENHDAKQAMKTQKSYLGFIYTTTRPHVASAEKSCQ